MRSVPYQSRLLRHSSGLTLVEVLVVIVLLGLITASVIPNLAGISNRSQLQQFVAELIGLDANGRMLSSRHQSSYIEYNSIEGTLDLFVVGEKIERVLYLDVPGFLDFEPQYQLVGDRSAQVFNRGGRTDHYQYSIKTQDSNITLSFNGLTGWNEVVYEGGS